MGAYRQRQAGCAYCSQPKTGTCAGCHQATCAEHHRDRMGGICHPCEGHLRRLEQGVTWPLVFLLAGAALLAHLLWTGWRPGAPLPTHELAVVAYVAIPVVSLFLLFPLAFFLLSPPIVRWLFRRRAARRLRQ